MHPRMAIVAATGTARKRVIPVVRERQLCTIVAIHGRDPHKLAAIAAQYSANEVEDFLGLLNGAVSVGTTIEEACGSVRILEAITKSFTTKRAVCL